MPKLIDAEAAKAAAEDIHDRLCGPSAWAGKVAIHEILAALDALPDASEGFFDYVAKEAHRTGKSPQEVFAAEWESHAKLKDDSLWPQQAGDGAEEE